LLEEVRMLSNLEATNSKLLQIILVGQPELRATLAVPGLRQLRQRISINCHLKALSRSELELYICHRLEVAGNPEAVHFSPDSLDAVFRYSRGIPRLINIICDFLMLSAFAEETTSITLEMIQEVIGDLDFENYYWTVAADEQCMGEDNNFLPIADSFQAGSELHRFFSDISRRIELIEQNIAAPLQASLKEQKDRFDSFQSSITSHITETKAHFLDLNRKLERLRNAEKVHEQGKIHETPKINFGRRFLVFGDDPTSSHSE
jgi:hypothetical protein